jgi:hypothetical protein
MEIPPNPHWAEVAESIDALGPDIIEMVDRAGKFIRAVKSDQFSETTEDEKSKQKGVVERLAFDAETARFIKVAELLADAHKFSETAFNKLAAIVDSVTTSSTKKDQFIEAMQRAYRKVLEENADLSVEAETAGEQDPMEMMMQAMFTGYMQSQAERKARAEAGTSKPTNGARAPTPTPTPTRPRAKA